LVNNKTTVELSWRPRCLPRSGQPITELLCVFVDKRGSLSAITSTLASLKINILGLSAFSTDTGIAIDTFEVDRFDESAGKSLIACMEGLAASRQVLSATVDPREERPLSSHLPSSYITSTTAQERVTHAQLFQRLVQHTSSVELSWHPLHDRPGVVLSCVFVDRRGSLSAITNTLASHGINIAGLSAFSTDTGIAIDTFEVDRFDESAAKSLISCMEGLYFSSNLPRPLMLLSASSPSHSPASSHSGSIRGGDSFVKHMSELSQRSPRPIQTERGSAVAALRFKSLLRNLAIGSSNGSARHTAR
jgi:acetolactate synthase small subunit